MSNKYQITMLAMVAKPIARSFTSATNHSPGHTLKLLVYGPAK
jgi:hypothetical protein